MSVAGPGLRGDAGRSPHAGEGGWGAVHLAVLWSLAVAQPVFDLIGRNAEFFVARRTSAAQIVTVALTLVIVPPVAMWAVELLAGQVSAALRRVVHHVLIGALFTLLALYALNEVVDDAPAPALVASSLLCGALGALAYARWRGPAAVLTLMAPVPLLFAALFLFGSPVTRLVFPDDSGATAGAGTTASAPVALLVLDELPLASMLDARGRIDGKRFPNFASLARDATWYPNAGGMADGTQYAVPSVFTGKRPDASKLPIAGDHPESIFSLLRDSHRMIVTEAVTRLCEDCASGRDEPSRDTLGALASDLTVAYLHLVAPESTRRSLPPVDRGWRDFRGPALSPSEVTYDERVRGFDRSLAVLGEKSRDARPPLFMAHMLLPHEPWQYLPSGASYPIQGATAPGLFDDRWAPNPAFTNQAAQRHVLQTGYVDRLLGRLLDRLRRLALYERAIVAVVADHGAAFRAGDRRRGVTRTNFAEVASVPMIVKAPGQRRPRVDERPVQTIDLMPMLAHHLGLDLPWELDGALPRGRGRRRIEVMDRGGQTLSVSATSFERGLDVAAAAMRKRVGSGAWDSLYGAGRDSGLLGAEVPAIAGPAGASADVAGIGSRASGSQVPAYVTGRVRARRPPEALALALDGHVRAVTRALTPNGDFSFLVAPRFGRRPATRVELFAVRASSGRRVFEPLAKLSAGGYELRQDEPRDFLISGGRRLRIEPGALDGHVDAMTVDGGLVRLQGWAGATADPEERRAADEVVVASGGRILTNGIVSLERDDLADFFGPPLRYAGYELTVRRSEVEACDLRVIAVLGKRATVLDWNPAAEARWRRLACAETDARTSR